MSDDPFGQIERVFDQFADVALSGGAIAVDVLERDDELQVTADLPGYDSADIDVRLREGHQLEISAERTEESETTEGTVHRQERRREAVSRTVTLPVPVDESGTEASYSNGVLTVILPKHGGDDEGTNIPVGE